MLHKSKSKKINLFKCIFIVPLLALFLMSFSTKNIYVEKDVDSPNSTSNLESTTKIEPTKLIVRNLENPLVKKSSFNKTEKSFKTSIEVIITKDFTDNELEKLKTKFKNEGYSLKFKDIKRNNRGEITAIKIEVSSNSSNANYYIDSDDTISPIKISVKDEGKNISIGNGHLNKSKNHVFVIKEGEKHKITRSDENKNIVVFSSDDKNEHTKVERIIIKNGDSIHVSKKHDGKMLEMDDNEDHIFTLDKNNSNKKHKIIKIYKDEDSNISSEENINEDIIIGGKSDSGVHIISSDGKEPLYIANGKEISSKEMKAINPDNIEKIEVLKGDGATKKYSEKGKNGVVLITTKK